MHDRDVQVNLSRPTVLSTGLPALLLVAALFVLAKPVSALVGIWWVQPEYSHGFLAPVIAAYLAWQLRAGAPGWAHSWAGVPVLLVGAVAVLIGEWSLSRALASAGVLILLIGLLQSLTGWRGVRHFAVPLAFLLFMLPLPGTLYDGLSLRLQLISSDLGTAVVRWGGVAAIREGNVIDLGAVQLQVAEACDGLRYLFPLMSLAFLVAVFLRANWFYKGVVMLASVPIAVFMNALRIGVTGILVEFFGLEAAMGFFHYFEGWVVFLGALILLLAVVGVVALVTRADGLDGVLDFDVLELRRTTGAPAPGSPTAVRVTALLVLLAASVLLLYEPEPIVPPRTPLAEFPRQIGERHGVPGELKENVVELLDPSEYLLTEYRSGQKPGVQLFMASWDVQRERSRTPTPRICLPGKGWTVKHIRPHEIPDVRLWGEELVVNRAPIQRKQQQQLVYYWYVQAGRQIISERMLRWYRSIDALFRRRSDATLIRLVTPLDSGETWTDADTRLGDFARQLNFDGYIIP